VVVDCPHQGPEVPQIDLMDSEVLGDPLAAYGRVREQGPLARLSAPLGASLAQVQTEVALTTLLRRFPDLALAVDPGELQRVAEPGSWRLATLRVTL
jgi:hypothetical protein